MGFSKAYQFYSLKDTGIVQMLIDGVPAIEVRNQAGHSSLEQTNQYAKYAYPKGSDFIKNL
jgi:integrase/recombinase XerD